MIFFEVQLWLLTASTFDVFEEKAPFVQANAIIQGYVLGKPWARF